MKPSASCESLKIITFWSGHQFLRCFFFFSTLIPTKVTWNILENIRVHLHTMTLVHFIKLFGMERNYAKKMRFDGTAKITTKRLFIHQKHHTSHSANAITSLEIKTMFFKSRPSPRMVRNAFSKIFLSLNIGLEQNSECFSLLQNVSERNSELFVFRGIVRNEITKFGVFFSSMKLFGTEFRAFLSSAEMVQHKMTKFWVFFFFMKCLETEFWTFYCLSQNGSERNYANLSVSLFYAMLRNGIPSFFYLPRNSRIPMVYRSATEWIKIPSVPCSSE